MAKFRSLSIGVEGLLLVDNYRHLQPVGNRKVFVRSVSSRFLMLDNMQNESEEDEDDLESIWYYKSKK
jgi:carbonic anhydrase